jgi:protein TonB
MSALALAMYLTGAGAASFDGQPNRAPPVQIPSPTYYRPPAPPPPPAPRMPGLAQRARANLNSYFRLEDYPAAALRANEQGDVGFRLTIGRGGRVSRCEVTSTSGSAALDRASCAILRERARYTPARDRRGRRTRGSDAGRVSWRLPVD